MLVVFNHSAAPAIYTPSLHDALPIYDSIDEHGQDGRHRLRCLTVEPVRVALPHPDHPGMSIVAQLEDDGRRSEEHTSELQSPCNLVCRLLLEKKNDRQLVM